MEELFFEVLNVSSYKFCEQTFEGWIIETNNISSVNDTIVTYLLIDQAFPAFGHWVFESAIFLPYFYFLKEKYPGLKLHFKVRRDFKILFCNLFNINEDEIVYELPALNRCIFPKPACSWNKKYIDPVHRSLINNFFNLFKKYIPDVNNVYEDIVLPRQKKENLVENDDDMQLLYIKHTFTSNNKNFLILNTDCIRNIQDQINILSRCKNITVVDGSALLVNGLFVRRKTFHVPGRPLTQGQSKTYPQLGYVLECSINLNKNTIHYYSSEKEFCQQYCKV